MKMRDLMNLVENAGHPSFYMHATSLENVPSISQKGLIANGGSHGNYEDSRWISLEGVYASNVPSKIHDYVFAHGLDDYALVLIEVDPAAILPDEDTIDILLDRAFRAIYHLDINDASEDERFDDPAEVDWAAVGKRFHELANGGGDAPYDAAFCTELADWWGDHKLLNGENIDPFSWMAIKDKTVRHYPSMPHPQFGKGWSVRHPGHIGFDGTPRIVSIMAVYDGVATVTKGTIPTMATSFVERFVDLA